MQVNADDYVPLETHETLVRRLVQAVEARQSRVQLLGARGSGKSTILREALKRLRSPHRAIASVSGNADQAILMSTLARRLGTNSTADSSDRRLRTAIQLRRLQSQDVIIAVDDAALPHDSASDWLMSLACAFSGHITCLATLDSYDFEAQRESFASRDGLSLAVVPLTRTEAVQLLESRLPDAVVKRFSRAAITALHARARGCPGVILSALRAELAAESSKECVAA